MKILKNKKIIAVVIVAIIGTIIFWKKDWIKKKLGLSKDISSNSVQENTTTVPPANPGIVYKVCSKPPYKTGCSGKHIKVIQAKLNKKFNAGLKVDGYFGAKTKQALINAGYGEELDLKEARELIK